MFVYVAPVSVDVAVSESDECENGKIKSQFAATRYLTGIVLNEFNSVVFFVCSIIVFELVKTVRLLT